jgi:hypothetical protein
MVHHPNQAATAIQVNRLSGAGQRVEFVLIPKLALLSVLRQPLLWFSPWPALRLPSARLLEAGASRGQGRTEKAATRLFQSCDYQLRRMFQPLPLTRGS